MNETQVTVDLAANNLAGVLRQLKLTVDEHETLRICLNHLVSLAKEAEDAKKPKDVESNL